MRSILVQYIKKNNGVKKGILVCEKVPKVSDEGVVSSQLSIGYSMCHRNDRFNYVEGVKIENHGLDIARSRAYKWADEMYEQPIGKVNIPHSIRGDLVTFIKRCERYFKGYDMPKWVVRFLNQQSEAFEVGSSSDSSPKDNIESHIETP